MRFQVADRREPKPDSDGDGFVDAADAAPDDPNDWLDIDGDGVGDNADPDDDNDGVPDSEDAFPLDPEEWADADLDGIGDNADDDVKDLSPFRDPNLRAVVEMALNKPPDAPITADDLASLEVLRAGAGFGNSKNIQDLTGLELAINLTTLTLDYNPISDLSPIAGLVRLKHLDIQSLEPVPDLSPLAGLVNLENLNLKFNDLSDLTPLAGLVRLEILEAPHNDISDLTPLAGLVRLKRLDLRDNDVSDLAPLAGLVRLEILEAPHNNISDLTPLADLGRLEVLDLPGNKITSVPGLAGWVRLKYLDLDGNNVTSLTGVAGSGSLEELRLYDNDISDLSPLSKLTALSTLHMGNNSVDDLSPLSALHLRILDVSHNDLSLQDVAALPFFGELEKLFATGLDIEDVSPLSQLTNPNVLVLVDNRISDVSPLGTLTGLHQLHLASNQVSDIAPLVNRSIWEGGTHAIEDAYLGLGDNPLSRISIDEHKPMLESWGVRVWFVPPNSRGDVAIPDPKLHVLIAEALAGRSTYVDSPVSEGKLPRLYTLRAFGSGVSDITGLEKARNLVELFLGSNTVSDIAALSDLPNLNRIDLSDNRITDIEPLVRTPGLGAGGRVNLNGNPLSEESLNAHVPALLERGVVVTVNRLRLPVVAGGEALGFDTAGYFAAILGDGIQMVAAVGDASMVQAAIDNGVLRVTPGAGGGTVTVVVTATDESGGKATLTFAVVLQGPRVVSLFPGASDPVRQGFERLVNHSARAAEVSIEAIDDAGVRQGPATLQVAAGEAVHFNSDDLEYGNAAKGLSGGTGSARDDRRLELVGDDDMHVLSYIRTEDGLLTAMHDFAPLTEGGHRVAIFNPGPNRNQVSLLRLINPGEQSAAVRITGIDDAGVSPGTAVSLSLDPGTVRTLDGQELESGAGLTGALGDGEGKWRLTVTADNPILVASLLKSPTGHLTNLSTVPDNKVRHDSGETTHHVPLFLSASDPKQRRGFVRVINRGDEAAIVRIKAYDDTDANYDTVTLTVEAGAVEHFNSEDLELGDADAGLSAGVGAGVGDWRLELNSEADLDVLAYVRTEDGFLTSIHDRVPLSSAGYNVPIFNPGSNRNQVSRLHLVNPGDGDARVTIRGVDDLGINRGGNVPLTVPAGRSSTISAQLLEDGGGALEGKLGDGVGKWRLTVTSDRPIQVLSLLESPTGHLTNLSTGSR